jgi:hypothetical protein
MPRLAFESSQPAALHVRNVAIMKKHPDKEVDDMRAEYDFSQGVRGKYAGRYSEGSNVVLLDPDVAAAFPDAKAVNDALRKAAGLK